MLAAECLCSALGLPCWPAEWAFACNVSAGGPEVVEPGQSCATFDDCGGCTFTQGYWKTHGPVGCQTGNNSNTWCVTSLTLGGVSYTDAQLCSILNESAGGNGYIIVAHQLIAAKLNSACGGATCDAADIAAGDTFLSGKVLPPVGSASIKAKFIPAGLETALDDFNNGIGCAQHCAGSQSLRPAGTVEKMKWGQLKSHYR